MSSRRGRQAVYLGVVPANWKPISFWSVPPSFEAVILYEKNLPMWQALGYARTFNKKQLQDRMPARRWAFVARHLRSRSTGEHPNAKQKRLTERRQQMREEIRQEILAEMKGGVA